MNFVQIWLLGLINPFRAFEALKSKPAPMWGFWAVLIRFVVTSLTTTLALYLLGRVPFTSSRLTFLTTENYYAAEILFFPIYGLAIWLLMSGIVYIVLSLTRKASDFDQILNIVGLGMLIPMPVVWLWDWTMIALNWYQMTVMAVSHSIFALWGVILYSVGFKRILGLRILLAIGLSLAITVVYISLTMIFIR